MPGVPFIQGTDGDDGISGISEISGNGVIRSKRRKQLK